VNGTAQYGDHLLFQRFYEAMPQEIDDLAEKMVGYLGTQAVDALSSISQVHTILENLGTINCLFKKALAMERGLQDGIRICNDTLESMGMLPLGLEDYLASLASSHETNIYLLQQRLYAGLTKKSFTSLEKSWSGNSTFSPIRRGEFDEDEEPFDVEDDKSGTGPAEHYFRHSPLHMEVRQLGEGGPKPPTPKEIIQEDPFGGEFSTLGRYVVDTSQPTQRRARLRRVEAKKQDSLFIPGITYKYTKDSFQIIHVESGLVVVSYAGNVRDPEKFVKLADRILRDMDWTAPDFVVEKEKSRQLTRQFQRHVELVPDPKTGELFYQVAGD